VRAGVPTVENDHLEGGLSKLNSVVDVEVDVVSRRVRSSDDSSLGARGINEPDACGSKSSRIP
jgi:hypothetical protein